MDWFDALIFELSRMLGTAGVAEEYQLLGALSLLYVGAILLVLVVILINFAVFRRPGKKSPGADKSEDRAPAEGENRRETELAAESVAETAPTPKPEPEPAPTAMVEPEPLSLYERLRRGLAKTQSSLVGRIDGLLRGRTVIDDELIEELEEILITADLGMQTTQRLIGSLEKRRVKGILEDSGQVRQALMEELEALLNVGNPPLEFNSAAPFVIMVIGVNGVGKTTTIGKLANQFSRAGKKVLLGAGDTFRAAAAEQLQIWGERAGVDVIRHAEGADPGAVAFDAARAAVARKADILILDTAGRLHTKVNLMEELKKVRRVLDREIPGAPHETLLVLDATTGQNALNQAKLFNEAVVLDGLALTKLDGTAKGGIVVAIAAELKLPVRYVGIGEGIDDLRPFDAKMFISALFGN